MSRYLNKSVRILRFALVLGFLLFLSPLALSQVLSPHVPPSAPHAASLITRPDIGFATSQKLKDHYQKHGREFGRVTREEYLRLAQALRDRPAGGEILETVREDGVVTRFDRNSGAFLACNPDGTIRTFFKPNDGEKYFRRQAGRKPSQ